MPLAQTDSHATKPFAHGRITLEPTPVMRGDSLTAQWPTLAKSNAGMQNARRLRFTCRSRTRAQKPGSLCYKNKEQLFLASGCMPIEQGETNLAPKHKIADHSLPSTECEDEHDPDQLTVSLNVTMSE